MFFVTIQINKNKMTNNNNNIIDIEIQKEKRDLESATIHSTVCQTPSALVSSQPSYFLSNTHSTSHNMLKKGT